MIFKSLRKFQKGKDSHVYGAAFVHDPERAANHQDKNDDFRLLHEAVEKCRKHLPCLSFRMESLLIFSRSLVFIIKLSVDIHSRLDEPSHDGGDHYYAENDDISMRYFSLCHKIFFAKIRNNM